MSTYICDLETTKNDDGTMRAWLIDACQLRTYQHMTVDNMDDFMAWLESSDADCIYWHNLKHDYPYLIYWLHEHGYTYTDKPSQPGEYTSLITDRNVWFYGSIVFPSKVVEVRDSYKKIPMSVAKMGKSYNIPVTKGDCDYRKYRPIGYQPEPDEIEYIHRDTEVVARVLDIHIKNGMTKLTAPADALEEYKHRCKNYEKIFATKFWNTHTNVEAFCRKSYVGGISWVNPEIKGKVVRHGVVYDYNSMYPSVMIKYPYPIGIPVRFYDKIPNGYPLYIARCKVNISRMPGHIACIRNPESHEWIEESYEGELVLTSIDIEILRNNYYMESGTIDVIEGYAWKEERGIFDDYVQYWGYQKINAVDENLKQLAKLMLNSLYGKFGTKLIRCRKAITFNDNGIMKLRTEEPTEGKAICVAIASFITAYARKELVETANNCYGFSYCDTDSLHLASLDGKCAKFVGPIDQRKFCCWKKESTFVRAKYLRQKTYIEERPNGKLDIAACGCPAEAKNYITFDNFVMGASYKGKLRAAMRVGGVELVDTRFTIRNPFFNF